MFSAGCSPRSSTSSTKSRQRAPGPREEQATSIPPSSNAWRVIGPAGVERDAPSRSQCRTCPRGPAGTAAGSSTPAGRRRSALRRRGRRSLIVRRPACSAVWRRHHEGVGVLRRSRLERGHRIARQRLEQGAPGWPRRVARMEWSSPRRTKPRALPAYSGTNSTSPAGSAGATNSRGPRSTARRTVVPGGLERLAVDLAEQRALGEVERADRDGVVLQGGRLGRTDVVGRPTPGQGDGERDRDDRGDRTPLHRAPLSELRLRTACGVARPGWADSVRWRNDRTENQRRGVAGGRVGSLRRLRTHRRRRTRHR